MGSVRRIINETEIKLDQESNDYNLQISARCLTILALVSPTQSLMR